MITISLLGLDPYISQHVSKAIHGQLVQLYELGNEEIFVYAPESFLLHDGIDQTSWHTIARIHAPIQFKSRQNAVAAYLLKYLKTQVIHVAIEFYYYEPDDRYQDYDNDYPKFITEVNQVAIEDPGEAEPAEIYQGDVFAETGKHRHETKK
jgi:hypothetical protein